MMTVICFKLCYTCSYVNLLCSIDNKVGGCIEDDY